MRSAPFVTVIVIVSGCGDNLRPVTHGVRSGDRLKATFAAGDGASLFLGFYDPVLGTRCVFEPQPDETHARCIPVTTEPTTGDAGVYIDDDCTVPIIPASSAPTLEVPRYARQAVLPCEEPALWRLGEPVELTQFYSRTASGACAWRAGSPGSRWYTAVERIPVERLAAGRIAIQDGAGPLRVRYVDGDDDSRQPVAMYDERMQAPCAFTDRLESLGIPLGLGCYPEVCLVGTDTALDETCTPYLTGLEDAAGGASTVCGCTTRKLGIVVSFDSTNQPSVVAFHEVGATVEPPVELYRTFEDTCEFYEWREQIMSRAGDRIEPVAGSRTTVESGRRLEPVVIAGGGAAVHQPWLRDTVLAIDCEPRVATDGVLRCLPAGLTDLWDGFFRDNLCSQPLRVAHDATRGAPVRWAIADDGRRTVYPVASELLPGNVFVGDPAIGQCSRHFWDRAVERFYLLGPEAAPDRFAELVELTE